MALVLKDYYGLCFSASGPALRGEPAAPDPPVMRYYFVSKKAKARPRSVGPGLRAIEQGDPASGNPAVCRPFMKTPHSVRKASAVFSQSEPCAAQLAMQP